MPAYAAGRRLTEADLGSVDHGGRKQKESTAINTSLLDRVGASSVPADGGCIVGSLVAQRSRSFRVILLGFSRETGRRCWYVLACEDDEEADSNGQGMASDSGENMLALGRTHDEATNVYDARLPDA